MSEVNAMALRRSRLATEWRAFAELWFWPLVVALLPYRAGIAFARWLTKRLTLYDEAARASLVHALAVVDRIDEASWLASYRFAQLVDHADLFWALTRSDRFLLKRFAHVRAAPPARRPVLVLSYHYGQGLWLIRWLREHGVRAHFVSVRWERDSTDSALTFLYGQLRLRVVRRLAEAAPIYVGGARRAIADALSAGDSVYGLVDVPVRGASVQHGNCVMFGKPMLLPTGLLDAAASAPASALILTSHVRPDGSRIVDAEAVEHAADLTIDRLARELEKRIEADSAMWHFWYLWGALSARAAA